MTSLAKASCSLLLNLILSITFTATVKPKVSSFTFDFPLKTSAVAPEPTYIFTKQHKQIK